MTSLVVFARHGRRGAVVVGIMHAVVVLAVIAVLVVGDVGVYVGLIVAQIYRSRLVVVVRIIVPIVG